MQEADFSDRSLGCVAEVPRGGLTWIMEGDEESVLRGDGELLRGRAGPR